MITFTTLFPQLFELAFGTFLIVLYKRGFKRYPGKLLRRQNDADLQFFLLCFLLSYTLIFWLHNLYYYRTELHSIWGRIYDILIPEGSSPWLKWAWVGYFVVLFSLTPLFKWRAAIKRMNRKIPIVKLQHKRGLIAYIREKRRQRYLRRAAKAELASPQDLKVDLEKSTLENEKAPLITTKESVESSESTASILISNSKLRRRHAHVALYSQWAHLVISSCYLANRSNLHGYANSFWGTYLDVFSLMIMMFFPLGWLDTGVIAMEAAVDYGQGSLMEGTVPI